MRVSRAESPNSSESLDESSKTIIRAESPVSEKCVDILVSDDEMDTGEDNQPKTTSEKCVDILVGDDEMDTGENNQPKTHTAVTAQSRVRSSKSSSKRCHDGSFKR